MQGHAMEGIMTGEPLERQSAWRAGDLATWLFNPFYYVAGGKALALGLVTVAAAGLLASLTDTHFDGVLDVHTRYFLAGPVLPFWLPVAEGLVDWLSLAVCVYLAGRLVSRTRFRALDVFGTQALARYPGVIAALAPLLPGARAHALRMVTLQGQSGFLSVAAFTATAILVIVAIVWTVVLMYRAYSVSCNVSGTRGVVSFVVALALAELLSKLALYPLFSAL
jgi:hypothetical protein